MEIQELERLAASLKPSGTIERGDTKSIERRGSGTTLRSQMQGNDIIKQSLELPEFSLVLNYDDNTVEVLLNGALPTREERAEVLRNAAHFLRHIQNRDQLSQNFLCKIESQIAALIGEDQERTIMGNGNLDLKAIRAGVRQVEDSTIVTSAPKYAMMERTTIETFINPKDLEQKRHLPLPMWSLITLSALFVIVTVVIVVILL